MGATAGIDVGGTKVLGVVLDDGAGHRARGAGRHTTRRRARWCRRSPRWPWPSVRYRGSASAAAGLVTRDGVLRAGPNLPGITELALREVLAERLGHDVVVENDATCACYAEWRAGAGRGVGDMALVTLGTGIGAGFVLGGALQRGAQGFAGEPGHMVVDPNGRLCVCGQRGLLGALRVGERPGRTRARGGRGRHAGRGAGGGRRRSPGGAG